MCYCDALVSIPTTTRVVLLQHPRERDMPIGTARMASLCLPNAVLKVGLRWDGDAALSSELSDPSRPPLLLYPGPGAKDVLAEPPRGPVTLVVVDGTWSQAKTVVRDNAVLRALPRYAFVPREPSRYRIRKEPKAECVSTLEALVHVLGALEGEPARFEALRRPMDRMIDLHLQHRRGQPRTTVPTVRPHPPGVPRWFLERQRDLVVVMTEAHGWPAHSPHHALGRELLRLLAWRPSDGSSLDLLRRPTQPMAPDTFAHVGLAPERWGDALDHEDFAARWRAFLRPSDLAVTWGPYARDLARPLGLDWPVAEADLRIAARGMPTGGPRGTSGRRGTLDEVARGWGLQEPEASGVASLGGGRAARRLGWMRQMLEAWSSPTSHGSPRASATRPAPQCMSQ